MSDGGLAISRRPFRVLRAECGPFQNTKGQEGRCRSRPTPLAELRDPCSRCRATRPRRHHRFCVRCEGEGPPGRADPDLPGSAGGNCGPPGHTLAVLAHCLRQSCDEPRNLTSRRAVFVQSCSRMNHKDPPAAVYIIRSVKEPTGNTSGARPIASRLASRSGESPNRRASSVADRVLVQFVDERRALDFEVQKSTSTGVRQTYFG